MMTIAAMMTPPQIIHMNMPNTSQSVAIVNQCFFAL